MQWLRWTTLVGAVAIAACDSKSTEKAPPAAGGGMRGMHMDSSGGKGAHTPSMSMMPVMRAHNDRVRRLIAMHEEMMRGMRRRKAANISKGLRITLWSLSSLAVLWTFLALIGLLGMGGGMMGWGSGMVLHMVLT